MEKALTNYLLAGAALVALLGNRITWTVRPQGSPVPALVLHRISGAPLYSDEGEAGLSTARLQADIWAKEANGESGAFIAKRVALALKARLSGPAAGRFASESFVFSGVFLEDEQDSFERGPGAEELNRVRQDYIIWYKEI